MPNANPNAASSELFKGAHADFKEKIFIKGPTHVDKYDDALKAYLTFFDTKYDQRVKRAFIQKDKAAGTNTRKKPKALMIKIVKQFATVGSNSMMVGREVKVMDRESEVFFDYQLTLKQYMFDIAIYSNTLETCYSILLIKCSLVMDQALESKKNFENIKASSDSIALIKLIGQISYNYQSYQYGSLAEWDTLDTMLSNR